MKVSPVFLIAAALAAAMPAGAADFPAKPVRLVIGFAPGGGTDTTAERCATPAAAPAAGVANV